MRVLMTGGGTAGHINPALAIADKIKKECPEAEFLFVGANGRMEMQLVPAAGYPIRGENVRGFQRRLTLKNIGRNLLAAADVVTSSAVSARIIREFRPDIAVGTGGYVCGPVLRQALRHHVPVVVHESNAFPGVTVKMLAKEGATILLCSEKARQYLPEGSEAVVTGNPLRPDFKTLDRAAARRELGVDDRPLLLSFGGSLGARHLNEAMTGVLARSLREGKLQHIHGTGRSGYEAMKQALETAGVPLNGDGIRVREYIDDMPRPYVAENHQYHNAMVLVEQGAAVCIEEKELTADRLWQEITAITADPARLRRMADAMRAAAVLDADERIWQVIRSKLPKA